MIYAGLRARHVFAAMLAALTPCGCADSDDAPTPTCSELGCADVAFCTSADADTCTCVVDGEPITCVKESK